jgi:phosphoribosylformylglycinamidine synthase
MAEVRGYPLVRLGIVDAEAHALEIQGLFSVPVEELREANTATLPKYFG